MDRIISTEFGEFTVSDDAVITFPDGIYGFEKIKKYILINHDEQGVIMTLQAVESERPQFIVLDPFVIMNNYAPILTATDFKKLALEYTDDAKFLVIAIVKENFADTVVNLKSPIVINPHNNTAFQIFLDNNSYSMRYPVINSTNSNGGE